MLLRIVPAWLSKLLLRYLFPRAPDQAVTRLLWASSGMVVVLAMGVVGYHLIEGYSPFDALYQTVLTVTTVGYQEVYPLSREARTFTIFVMIIGVGIALYLLTAIATLILEGDLHRDVQERRRRKMIEELSGHRIMVGAGRLGFRLADLAAENHETLVIVERDPTTVASMRDRGWLVVEGDGQMVSVLQEAGAERASELMVITGDDGANLITTMRASELAPELTIIARVNQPDNEDLMRRAGATKVLSPISMMMQEIYSGISDTNGS